MKRFPVLLPLLLLLLTTPAFATNYTVRSEAAMKEIIPGLKAGDVVTLAEGNYTPWQIDLKIKGTRAKPVIIRAATAGSVVFSGEVSSTLFHLSGDFIELQQITFKNCVLKKGGVLVEISGSNNRLSNCSFEENTALVQFSPLVIVSGNGSANRVQYCSFNANTDNQDLQVKITRESCPTATVIAHNTFTNKKKVSWKNNNGGECVQIGQDPVLLGTRMARAMVTDNIFKHCDAEGEVISNKSSGNSYLRNRFEDNQGELVMRGGHDCVIRGNEFKGGLGIRINGTGHIIAHNKFTGVKTAIRLMYGMATGKITTGFYIAASGCKIENNTIDGADTGILIGDSKDVNWTGKFDTVRYPSRVMQDVAPFDNRVAANIFKQTKATIVKQ